MIAKLLASGLAVLCSGAQPCAIAQTATPQPIELSVMTFNIRYGTADDGDNSWPLRSAMVWQLIQNHAPDVVGLQEALRFQLDEIRSRVPGYAELGVGRDDGRTRGEYSAILYRSRRFAVADQGTFWFSETPDAPGSTSWGNRITRICTWARLVERETGAHLYVYNLHLDHESQPSRERSVELLAAHINARRPRDPVIVMGDFNAGEDNPAVRYLTGEIERASSGTEPAPPSPKLADTFRAVHPTATGVGTFHGFRGDRTGARIDAILASPQWEVLDAAIVRTNRDGRYPSDHFPVTARLRLTRP
ncbi:MAG: endonuclease [Gemmatimonadales bacterium]|nr:endonuclease [Gemmatimonadales bacterium]NIN10212.1 endonuclease [Gemmatimonadales bacterium]NIN48968.1 endonuclease [Gemmatimonadales bacterium]NIP06432.1 endonuclease [Gemmatimonadales bacterium]NIQ98784.1 endonuclease [Gemmatimonadales bacterium]